MKNLNLNTPSLHGAYMQAVAKAKPIFPERSGTLSRSRELRLSIIIPKLEEKKAENGENHKVYSYSIKCEPFCPKCKAYVIFEEIFCGWKKSFNDYVSICSNCLKDFVPKFNFLN